MEMLWAIFFTLVIKATGAPTSQNKRQHIIYEAKDVKDTWAESRPARNTDNINYNVPEDCENECPEMYEPVCGTDGLTHHNKCKLKVSACYKPEDNVTIHHLGECLRENEPYIRNNLITDGNEIMNVGNNNDEEMLDSDGCWYHVLSKVLPYGTKGYDKCKQMQCQNDKDWHHTGERLPNCDDGSVKCWNWVTNETVPLESTMDFECNQYLCTEEDWVLSGERMSCEGCISATTEEYLPQGFNGYWKCEQFECLKNNSWQKTGERLSGCSVGEVKCWDWNQKATVAIGSEMIHNDMSLVCTEEDWLKININVSSSAEIEGCLSKITNEVAPYGTKGYYMCEQFECLGNNTWHKNGKTLSGCSLGEMKCLHWYDNEIVHLDSVMLHNCTQYICTDKDWKKTEKVNLSCLENKGCVSIVTKAEVPYGWKGYYNCKQYECMGMEEWKTTGEILSDCTDGKSRCWDWHQDEGVPVNSVLIQDNIQYTCTEDDWKKTIILDPSSNLTEGCLSEIINELVPYDYKGYYICEQFECLKDSTWHKTGKNLTACSNGEVKCWDWKLGAAVPINSRLVYNNNQYECTEEDWIPLLEQELKENKGCVSIVTKVEVPYGWKGYYNCKQYECTENEDWKLTDERLSGCSDGKTRCWDWHQDEGVPVNSVLIQDNIQYTCTENDWKKTIVDSSSNSTQTPTSSMGTDGCLSKITNEVVPYDHKGYYVCEQFVCLRNNSWLTTGKNLSACSNGEVKCWDWNFGAAVPINSRLVYNNNQYECTEEDWIPFLELEYDEPAMIPEERFDAPLCVPGVTSEHDGQQCCCSEEALLECNGPCPESMVTDDVELVVSTSCVPGEPIEGQDEKCCCTSDGILDCSGNSCQEPESTTMMEMETTTEESSSTRKEISLLLLLSAALFCI